jgi:hypothetical protein
LGEARDVEAEAVQAGIQGEGGARVPTGIDFLGSLKSPDIETPASKPVTAGKKTPNRSIKGTASETAVLKDTEGVKL